MHATRIARVCPLHCLHLVIGVTLSKTSYIMCESPTLTEAFFWGGMYCTTGLPRFYKCQVNALHHWLAERVWLHERWVFKKEPVLNFMKRLSNTYKSCKILCILVENSSMMFLRWYSQSKTGVIWNKLHFSPCSLTLKIYSVVPCNQLFNHYSRVSRAVRWDFLRNSSIETKC